MNDDDDDECYVIRRDGNSWHVRLDLLFIYALAFLVLAVVAIKALRWAVTS